jgi:hypothetical protein
LEDRNLYFLVKNISYILKVSLLPLLALYIARDRRALSEFFALIYGMVIFRMVVYIIGFFMVTNNYIVFTGNVEYCQMLIAKVNPVSAYLLGIISINFILKVWKYGFY